MKVVSFYRFLDLDEAESFCGALQALCEEQGLLGTILVAKEGFNGTLAGAQLAIETVFSWIERRLQLATPIDGRWTDANDAPFLRMRVRCKNEIVTLGRPDILPHRKTGVHVQPRNWNALISDPDVLLIDTRNHYEIEVGSFPGAVDPRTDNFRQFAAYASELAATSTDRPLAMYCTGGIRCEKAAALMLELGFDEVYQLQGGILNYLSEIPPAQSRWNGDCFVFDKRVAIDSDLAEGGYMQGSGPFMSQAGKNLEPES
ncbi:MAG: rhodanese-like domain-containing protein [Gammaproteobacteria bacterium]|nr:rhodanese-like domain-containing protein [Gammaproteobacteria bacterium]MDH5304043.1 rhodanese-like domain-containing protein [Gammaproteobacteria bacterium]MDH5321688.1 rhodanese-like domain-containing protein [Gammaproteobacteria bacterium]